MRRVAKFAVALIVLAALTPPTYAETIELTPGVLACTAGGADAGECLMTSGNQTSNAQILAAIAIQFPSLALNSVYKQNVGEGSDSGGAAAWYETVFAPPADPSGATITWVGPGYIAPPTYLIVKDGNATPAWYFYDISDWGGKDLVTLTDFWPNQGAISHVEIFGTPVPDGGSMTMLLGMALIGLAGARRLMK